VSFVSSAAAWGFARSDADPDVHVTAAPRASVAARSRPLALLAPVSPAATVEIDGLRVSASGTPGQTVGDLLRTLGLDLTASDAVSAPLGAAVVPGMHIVVDRGIPLTLVDGGIARSVRARRGTVGDLLAGLGLALGPLDRLDPAPQASLQVNSTVRLVRVSDREVKETEELPFPVQVVRDLRMEVGSDRVDSPGSAGEVQRTYVVRYVDGAEAERAMVAEVVAREPVMEIRIVGAKPRPAPPAPGEIDAIIRAAAATWGADPQLLLRIAWCESRYNSHAVNRSSGASGLFQFMPVTWARNAPLAGYADASIFDPVASANTAARLFALGHNSLWACK
jgi:uncharacterized protein YabE (DUF348 family)